MKNKGFTLVEIILTIALIGIIAAGFLTLFPNYMRWMIRTKENTTGEAFVMQKNMERNIDQIKKTLANGEEPDLALYDSIKDDIFLFSSKFPKSGDFDKRDNTKVYIINSTSDSGKSVVSWVGETRLPALPAPVLDTPTLKFVRGSATSHNIKDKFEYFNYSELKMLSETSLLENPQNSFYRNKHEWYVSNPGYLIPRPILEDIDIDIDLGTIYPVFPNDYNPIPIYAPELNSSHNNTISNNNINKYKGRHIIYTITPYSKDLKKGIMKTSSPLYLLGLPYSNKLKVHLDASTFDLKDETLITEDIDIGYIVKKWKNISPSPIIANLPNAVQTDRDKRPILIGDISYGEPNYKGPVVSFQREKTNKVYGRALGNNPSLDDSSFSNMIIEDSGKFIINNNGFNLFIIMRKTDPLIEGPPIIEAVNAASGNEWYMKWFDDSSIELSTSKEEDPLSYISNYNFLADEWNLINLQFKEEEFFYNVYNLTAGKENVFEEKDDEDDYEYNEYISTERLELNFNGVEISEILIYTDNSNSESIINYLKEKYNP